MLKLILANTLLLLICTGCVLDLDDHKLVLLNNTHDTVYYRLKVDTALIEKDVSRLQDVYYFKLSPHDSAYPLFARVGEGWEQKLYSVSKDSLFRLYLFNTDTVSRYGWKTIINRRLYTRLDLSVPMLDSLHWHVLYLK